MCQRISSSGSPRRLTIGAEALQVNLPDDHPVVCDELGFKI